MAEIIFDRATKIFGEDIIALEDATLEIARGEFVFVIGHNGAGKSTLLKVLTGQTTLSRGDIFVQGQSVRELSKKQVPYYRRRFGIMSNEFGLLGDRSVYDNVLIALRAVDRPIHTMKRDIRRALAVVGLSQKESFYPHELSIGEAARVRLARAIVTQPAFLIADEPTANLDAGLAWDIMCLLDEINRTGVTVIVASHSRELVSIMRKRVITLVAGAVVSDVKKGEYNSKALDIFEYRKVMRKRQEKIWE